MPNPTEQKPVEKAKKPLPFEINGVTLLPGTRQLIDMPLAQLYTNTPLHVPVEVIHGSKPGPCLLICAAIHGDEINGVEIIRRVLKIKSLKYLHGTLIAVPIANVFGFIHKSRYLPDRRDLNRNFPGHPHGSLASRFAFRFKTEILDKCTHMIDLHTGAQHRTNLPQIRATLNHPVVEQMAHCFGVPVIVNSNLIDGSIRALAHQQEIAVITYEAGEALRFEESCIQAGMKGIINVMRYLKMIRNVSQRAKNKNEPFVAKSSAWVRAERDGIFRPLIGLGARVRKNDTLAMISDPFGSQELPVISPLSGILIGRNNLPLVNEGEALFHIARFEENQEVAKEVERFQEALTEDELIDPEEPPII